MTDRHVDIIYRLNFAILYCRYFLSKFYIVIYIFSITWIIVQTNFYMFFFTTQNFRICNFFKFNCKYRYMCMYVQKNLLNLSSSFRAMHMVLAAYVTTDLITFLYTLWFVLLLILLFVISILCL